RLTRIIGLPTHRPRLRRALARVVDTVAPVRVAGGEEHLRHLALVEVAPRRQAWGCAEASDDYERMLLLDELLDSRHGLCGVVRVVDGLVEDLAVEDAAGGVDVVVPRLLRHRDRLVQRGRARVRERAADHDLLLGHARRALRRGPGGAGYQRCDEKRAKQ